ncbi:hypothetical protein CQ13_04540 [Bradyrhizobium retamae]|jgi:hypothetical protein|uniref:Myb-like domain-containing protein n=1 Tax=Bradyrhizobium retamae TaxID=1300035 RepID=A0A0R3N5B1_9BRAD|nr:hypothetical protein CQ13_04540 [Bradyrhizobium retamae]
MMMSTLRERHGRFWSDEDDNLLRSMSQAGKSLTLMTVRLNRPMASIKARAQDLGIPIPGTDIGTKRKRSQPFDNRKTSQPAEN